MFAISRKYASVLLIALMSMFAVALAIDEYNDSRHALEDLSIETCAELETENFEWDEDGADNGDGQLRIVMNLCVRTAFVRIGVLLQVQKAAILSEEQKLGLVRRYAPRKDFAGIYYKLT